MLLSSAMHSQRYRIEQTFEAAELFGFETRNKYRVIDVASEIPVFYIAEQRKGLFNLVMRGFMGHWRRFDFFVFDTARVKRFRVHHPFCWLFPRLEVFDESEKYLGAIQKRFAILRKRIDVVSTLGQTLFEMSSPLWRIWTFPFTRPGAGIPAAQIEKKWGGIFTEIATDKDRFQVSFLDPRLNENDKLLVLFSGLLIDLVYFEKKASSR